MFKERSKKQMGNKISKKLTASAALGAAVIAPIGVAFDAEARETDYRENILPGTADEDGNLYGYYTDDGTWIPNRINIKLLFEYYEIFRNFKVFIFLDSICICNT